MYSNVMMFLQVLTIVIL